MAEHRSIFFKKNHDAFPRFPFHTPSREERLTSVLFFTVKFTTTQIWLKTWDLECEVIRLQLLCFFWADQLSVSVHPTKEDCSIQKKKIIDTSHSLWPWVSLWRDARCPRPLLQLKTFRISFNYSNLFNWLLSATAIIKIQTNRVARRRSQTDLTVY